MKGPVETSELAASRVTGGIVVRVGKSSVYFAEDKGTVNELHDVEPLDSFARIGKTFVSARMKDTGMLELAWSGTPVTHATWRLAKRDPGAGGRLITTSSGVFVLTHRIHEKESERAFVPIPATRASDPVELVPAAGREILGQPASACVDGAQMLTVKLQQYFKIRDRIIDAGSHYFEPSITSTPLGKGGCAALFGSTYGGSVVVPAGAAGQGWVFGKEAAQPSTCQVP